MGIKDPPQGGGISDHGLAEAEKEPLGGTGGSAGGGTRAGEGDPSGAQTARDRPVQEDADDLAEDGHTVSAADELAGREQSEVAAEAAALGPDNGELADRAGEHGPGPTIGQALGSGAGKDVGAGTPPDRAGLGGGGPLGEEGGPGPEGTRPPGGNGAR